MGEWRTVPLGELVREAGGFVKTGPFGSQLHADEYVRNGSGVPVVMPKNMTAGRVDRASVSRVAEGTAERLGVHRLAPGDVVLARRGDLGRFAFIEHDESGWVCGTGCLRVHAPDHEVLWPQFLRHAVANRPIADWLLGQAVGATMPNLNAGIVEQLPLRIPTLKTQRRIAAVLSVFDDLIEINERRIELLEDLARSLYREWFVRFRFPGHEAAAFDHTESARLPSGWELLPLRDVVDTKYGYTATGETEPVGPQFLRGTDINKRSFINWSSVPYCQAAPKEREKFSLEVGDVCVIRMADPGKVGIVERRVDAVFASYLVRMRTTDARLSPYLLFHHLDAEPYQSWISGSSTGATRKSASASVLTEPKVPLPAVEVAQTFEAAVGPLRAELTNLVQSSEALAATRDLLLPRLVTGRLDIDDVDLGDLLPAEAA